MIVNTAEGGPSLRRRPRPPRGTGHERRRAAYSGTSTSNLKLGHGRHIGRKHFGGKVFVARAVQAREEATRITRHQDIVQFPRAQVCQIGRDKSRREKSKSVSSVEQTGQPLKVHRHTSMPNSMIIDSLKEGRDGEVTLEG